MKLLSKKQSGDDRRQRGDRRRRDRRRSGPERFIVIEITRDALRAGVLTKSAGDGADSVDASSIAWRSNAPHLRDKEAVKELSAALRKLASRHAINGASVHVVLSGEYCVTRVLRGPSDEIRAELKELEQRSRLYLALGPGDKATVTQVKAPSARVMHAITVACHQDTLKNVHLAFEAAGLHVECIEPELTALSRAAARLPDVPDDPYLLALVDGDSIELGLCLDGELLTDYRPGGRVASASLPEVINQHLARLERYAARFIEGESARIRRIYLAGDAQAVAKIKLDFSGVSSIDVRLIDAQQVQATWEIQPDAAEATTPASLGGLLAAYYPPSQRDCPNLLQHLVAQSREPVRPIIVRSLLPIAATVLLAIGASMLLWHEQESVAQLEEEFAAVASVQGRATELRLMRQRTETKLVELELLASQISGLTGRSALQLIANSMPDDVWLRRFTMIDMDAVSLEGASYLEAGVYDFVRWLEQAPGCREVALQGANPGTSEAGPVTNFTLEVRLAEPGESHEEVARRE
ncbi:MAG: PilN domain-containing protein [Planctomycetales bacterium]|nr:PilN domain-containing protein [Planctomycetales bacterium]